MNREKELDELVAAFGQHVHHAHANTERIGCPPQSELVDLVNQCLSPERFASILEHIRDCAVCLDELARLRRERTGSENGAEQS